MTNDGLDGNSGLSRCPLCYSQNTSLFEHAYGRDYHGCNQCRLVYLDPTQRLPPAAERNFYLTHENDPSDPRYRRFLSQLAAPMTDRLSAGAVGLDYGCGTGPALAAMLRGAGFEIALYDPFFAPDEAVLQRHYDFITCTEVAEHFFDPGEEFARLDALLLPGGWLGIMTQVLADDQRLRDWRYARDPTHVSFYRTDTFAWIARSRGWRRWVLSPSVVLFRKAE